MSPSHIWGSVIKISHYLPLACHAKDPVAPTESDIDQVAPTLLLTILCFQLMRTSTSPAMSRSERPRTTTWPCTRPTLKTCTRRRHGYFSCPSNGPRTCPCSPTFPLETRWDAALLAVIHSVEVYFYRLHNTVGHRLFSVVWSWDPILIGFFNVNKKLHSLYYVWS